MIELNKIYNVDVLDGLAMLDDNSIDLIITSPPYNKVGLNGKQKGKKWNKTIDYNGDPNNDSMEEGEYQEWQVKILNECLRVLKSDGSMFYNHKNRIHNGEIVSPYQWIYKSNFKIRQEIIWDRISDMNVNRRRYIPTTEKIFWLTKTNSPKFDRQRDTLYKNEVWKIYPKRGTEHPAPFPIELPDNIIPNISLGEKITVLDPFSGSGTVLVSAKNHNCNWIGFEKFKVYVDMAYERIEKESTAK